MLGAKGNVVADIHQQHGVAYCFGHTYAVRAVVSLWSMRRANNWDGHVAIVTMSEKSARMAADLMSDERLVPLVHHPIKPADHKSNGGLLTKTKLFGEPLFDQTLFIDADTLVLAPVADAFQFDEKLCLTQFANRTAQHPDVKQNVQQWLDIEPDLANRSMNSDDPAINTGVFLFSRDDPQLERWRHLAFRGADNNVPDEIAAQLLVGEFRSCRVLPEDWNCSPKYGADPAKAKILHFHNTLHREAGPHSAMWWSMLAEVRKQNIGSINTWGFDDPDMQNSKLFPQGA